jgi:hypothetical protein
MNLLEIAKLRANAETLKITDITQKRGFVLFRFTADFDFGKLSKLSRVSIKFFMDLTDKKHPGIAISDNGDALSSAIVFVTELNAVG